MENEQVKKWKKASFLSGIVFFLTVIFLMIWGYNALLHWAKNKKDVPINQVVVHGEFNYLNAADLENKIKQKLDGSFFSLNVEQLRRIIQDDPWIYGVSIRKEWPQKVHVFIVEQKATAKWNNDLLLNQFGDVFFANGIQVDELLPKLYGPEGTEKDVLKGYVDMQYLLELHEFKIRELVLSERYAWQIWLEKGIHLNLGRADKMSRVQRFIDMYPLLEQYNEQDIAQVDLRYDIGLAVSWQ